MSHIHDILEAVSSAHQPSVLATVIKVEGSAYRKEGTMMLIRGAGDLLGTISAGCLEIDLTKRAEQLMNSEGRSETYVYDMSSEDDLGWGRGAGCNGKVHILLEKVNHDFRKVLSEIKTNLDQTQEVYLIRHLNSDRSIQRYSLKSEYPIGLNNGCEPGKKTESEVLFIQYFRPQEKLVIFGAGPDVPPLVTMANQVGYAVTVWDWRKEYCNPVHYPQAKLVQSSSIKGFLEQFTLDRQDSIVIMTHDFEKDKEILKNLLSYEEFHYLGILGPRKRTQRLMDDRPIPQHIHSPVGLAIKAEGPEEIAISILAQLIKNKRKTTSKENLLVRREDHRNLSCSG